MQQLTPLLSFLLHEPQARGGMLFVAGCVLGLLLIASIEDARSGHVPDIFLAVGGMIALIASLALEGQSSAMQRLLFAAAVIFALWAINEIYFRIFARDAFGFGDIKWSGLAAFIFGFKALAWTWVLAAWLGLFWMLGRKILGLFLPSLKPGSYIHFAPFLFAGLAAILAKPFI